MYITNLVPRPPAQTLSDFSPWLRDKVWAGGLGTRPEYEVSVLVYNTVCIGLSMHTTLGAYELNINFFCSVMVSVVMGPNPVPSPANIRTGPQFQTTYAAGKRSRGAQTELALPVNGVHRQRLLQRIQSASTPKQTFSVRQLSELACVVCTGGTAASPVQGQSSCVSREVRVRSSVQIVHCVVRDI